MDINVPVQKVCYIRSWSSSSSSNILLVQPHYFYLMIMLFPRDLSNTAITSLPTEGLQNLETLRIEKTPSLKYIPSIYEFQVSDHCWKCD